jgi:hypothetical protein
MSFGITERYIPSLAPSAAAMTRVRLSRHAARTVKAFGGADRLRAEIKNQRIDFDRLSPELQEAFKPYFGTANQIKPKTGFAQDFKSRAKYAWFATAFPETREAAGKALDPRTRRPAKYKRPQTC